MLHYPTIFPLTLELLQKIQADSKFKDFILVGGTSLALQIGHRISIDLDFFRYSNEELDDVFDWINAYGDVKIINRTPRIINSLINEIKVDFVSYRYPFIDSTVEIENLKLASKKDIAAMKLSAITGRGTKKDFIDLYFLLDYFSLPEMFEFFQKKYPDGSEFLVFRSLTYFEDADLEPMPKMIEKINWEKVKTRIVQEVKIHFP